MKDVPSLRFLPLMWALLLLPATAQVAEPAADAAWAAHQAALSAPPDKPYAQLTPVERYAWIERRMLKARELGLAFIEQHPTDPRRWKVVATFTPWSPGFVKDWGALNEKGIPISPVVDEVAAAAWGKQVAELQAAMRQADDLPDDLRIQLAAQEVANAINTAGRTHQRGEAVDLSALRARLQAFASRYPASPAGTSILFSYANLVEKMQPAQIEGEWLVFADSPHPGMADVAKGKLTFLALAKNPLELAFTAVDGREVDLKKLRGKVVLIDFWATWCGPCIAEIPNVKKVYAEYHDKGFEIIGISLDDEKDRQKFIELVKAEGTTWPQRFEGKGWKDSMVKTYTISGIPAMFLLDQNGMLVSTNARGEKLGSEVKRLLKL